MRLSFSATFPPTAANKQEAKLSLGQPTELPHSRLSSN